MRRPRRDDDSGFALVFTLFVVTMVAVATAASLVVTTPDIARTAQNQDALGAGAAARAAIDDFIAYLSGIDQCRTTTRVCSQALAARMTGKALPGGVNATMSWTSDPAVTADGNVRVHATGTYGRATSTLDADIALAPSILSYGYYSDYESQSSDALNSIYRRHNVYLDRSSTWQYVAASQATTVSWGTPSNTTVCDRHWWADPSTTPATAGRSDLATWTASYGVTNGRGGSFGGGCDIIFASGMTLNGPVYTRDALFIDGTGGSGPLFQQKVLTGWGYGGRTVPAFPLLNSVPVPWRYQNGGTLAASPVKPAVATFDLTLPTGIGTEGLSANACLYTGPTRVRLNGDGTATITSPRTTTAASSADPGCYPSGLGAGGIVGWTVPYGSVGGGTILVKNIGTEPSSGWAKTGQKVTSTPAASTSTFWNTASGGLANTGTSAASDTGCSSTVAYSPAVNATCAWSDVPSYTSSSGGWTKYTSGGSCTNANFDGSDQRQFECEYSAKTGSAQTYATFRAAVRNALTTSTCATAGVTVAATASCLATLLQGQLPAATSRVRYMVTPTTGASSNGTAQALTAGSPGYPQASDPMFANGPVTAGTQTPTSTPYTFAVTRQTSTDGLNWGGTAAQFTVTVTGTTWTVTTPTTAVSYFPAVADVTQYASAVGSAVPGDLYVEGTNRGKLSLLADNDVVVTNNLVNATTNIVGDAVNIVAGQYVRNYHPVTCVTTTANSVAATDPGFCPNDLTGIATVGGGSNGAFGPNNAVAQYTNLQGTGDRTIQAAIFALNGSLTSDNYNRGSWMGNLLVKGGVYQGHRGVNGTQLQNSDGTVARSGYLLNYSYVDLRNSNLPYQPTTRVQSGRVWSVVSVAGSGAS